MDVVSIGRDELVQSITVRGEIDLATAGDLLARLLMLAGPGHGAIVLDLSQVSFIDCTGLRALIALDRHTRTCGVTVHVAAASFPVVRLFELVGLRVDPDDVGAPPDLGCALDGRSMPRPRAAV